MHDDNPPPLPRPPHARAVPILLRRLEDSEHGLTQLDVVIDGARWKLFVDWPSDADRGWHQTLDRSRRRGGGTMADENVPENQAAFRADRQAPHLQAGS